MRRKYQYQLMPRTYKTVERVIYEFYEYCTERRLTPTLVRLEQYIAAQKKGEK